MNNRTGYFHLYSLTLELSQGCRNGLLLFVINVSIYIVFFSFSPLLCSILCSHKMKGVVTGIISACKAWNAFIPIQKTYLLRFLSRDKVSLIETSLRLYWTDRFFKWCLNDSFLRWGFILPFFLNGSSYKSFRSLTLRFSIFSFLFSFFKKHRKGSGWPRFMLFFPQKFYIWYFIIFLGTEDFSRYIYRNLDG